MKVTDIEIVPVDVGLKGVDEPAGIVPYVAGKETVERRTRLLVKLDTEGEITGWGEASPEPTTAIVERVVKEVIRPKLVGRPVWEIRSLTQEFFFWYANFDHVLGAIEMAMWDALGKHLGASVHQLVGGKCTDSVEFAYLVGILDRSDARKKARHAVELGFDTLKTKGGPDWQADVERVLAMDDEVDGDLEFVIDPNQTWTVEDTVRAGAMLEDAGVYLQYFEQPIRIDSFGSLKRLRQRLRTPIGVNEDTYEDRNLLELAKEDAIDVAVVDHVPSGGMLRTQEQLGIALDLGISVAHHCSWDLGIRTAALLQTVSTTPAINLPCHTVYYAYEDDVITTPFEFDDGRLPVPDEPGLGVTLDEDKIEQYRTD